MKHTISTIGDAESAIPSFDEAEFAEMVERGTAAWASVSDATDWLESLRADDTEE